MNETTRTLRPGRLNMAGAFLLVAAALFAIGCGGSQSDQEEINSLVRTFLRETLEGDAGKAYDLLDSQSKANCNRDQFVEEIEELQGTFGVLGSLLTVDRVEDLKISGDTATARVYTKLDGETTDGEPDETPFRKEGGKWRISEAC